MTTKDDDTARAKQQEDEQRKQAAKQSEGSTQKRAAGQRSGERSGGSGGEDERAPASITEFDYDPMQDPTFNKNEAQQYAEPGHAGSEDAEQATQDAD